MRYSRAVPTRVTGPEWTEPDFSENESQHPAATPFHHEELQADFELDLRLHEILEHALRATAATGAVIALASGDKMVCRATTGDKAPSIGAFLNTRSGLSGLCVQTRDMQTCEDAITDPRVNADACRSLDIRSIIVLPVVEGKTLWGILEIFSSSAHAFSDADVQALQALGRRVSHTVQEAVEGGNVASVTDAWGARPNGRPEPVETMAHEIIGPEIPRHETLLREIVESGALDSTAHRRDYRTAALTAAVIALAVLLGWMVGRAGWSMAVNRADAQLPLSPEAVEAAGKITPPTVSPAAATDQTEVSAKATSPAKVASAASRAVLKPKPEATPAGGLVVYEQGKVVFRMAPSPKSPSADKQGSEATAVTAQGGENDPAPAANSYLVERVEPVYPEEARQQRVQGPVVLTALVGTNGAVRQLKVVSGDPLLVTSATDAVRQWRFQSHVKNGRLVEFETTITVNFSLP